jgi:DNA repair exonuclease SbcCD nuclease subunit
MRILLVSDLHLDSPFAWAKPEVGRKRRQALRDALAQSIHLALDQRVDVICCGGDLFEHDRVSPDTGQFLRALFEGAHPIRVFIAPGNHDWLGPESLYGRVRWSPNVYVFEQNRLVPVTIVEGLTLWGSAHRTPAGTPNFLGGFKVDRGGVHVALFHGSEQGSFYTEETGKEPYAPFRAAEIEASGLHFALLGHYHAPRDAERFTYPGNPEPLTFGESGQRAAIIAAIGDEGRVTIERHSVAVTDVCDVRIGVDGCTNKQEIRDRVAGALENRRGYARVTLTGELVPDIDLQAIDLEDVASNLDSPPIIRLESVTVAYNLTLIGLEPTVRGQFVRDVQGSDLSPEERRRVIIIGLRALDGRNDLQAF